MSSNAAVMVTETGAQRAAFARLAGDICKRVVRDSRRSQNSLHFRFNVRSRGRRAVRRSGIRNGRLHRGTGSAINARPNSMLAEDGK